MLQVTAQTQAALSSLNVTVQHISNDMHLLKEQMKPVLKKRKVSGFTHKVQAHTCNSRLVH